MIGACMYFSEWSNGTVLILFGARLTGRRTENQVQGNSEDGGDDAAADEGERGTAGQVAATPQGADQEKERAQDDQPVGDVAAPGELRRQHPTETAQVDEGNQGKGREQRMLRGCVERGQSSLTAIGPPPM